MMRLVVGVAVGLVLAALWSWGRSCGGRWCFTDGEVKQISWDAEEDRAFLVVYETVSPYRAVTCSLSAQVLDVLGEFRAGVRDRDGFWQPDEFAG